MSPKILHPCFLKLCIFLERVALLVGHERKFEFLTCQPLPGDSFFWKCSKVKPLRRPCVTQNFASLFFKTVYFSSTALGCVRYRGTGIVVTGKVVKLDLVAFAGLRCISHWRCVE